MSATRMHDNEVHADASLVRRLIEAQFPRWAGLAIERVDSSGTDNAIFRLGDSMAVRLPRVDWAVGQVEKEHTWLPRLAPHLPLAIPAPLAKGAPAEGYPWPWSVYSWLEGENATSESLRDLNQAATDLARFIAALRDVNPGGGPAPGQHNFFRGAPLARRDARVRELIEKLEGEVDIAAVTNAWKAALRAPPYEGAPVWIHGDLQHGNLLATGGRLSAVIDFGMLSVGDPACDLTTGWMLFSGESRAAFRAALAVDDATWARARGWALSWAIIVLPYYLSSNPVIVANARHAIAEVLIDG